ncbi:sigma-54 interaction domain-containing protein [Desulfocurvus sp. DL9XJH121]
MELEAIFDACHDAIVVADPCGVFLRINKNYENITGVDPQDLIGISSLQMVKRGLVSDSPTHKVAETSKPQSMTQIFRSGKMSHSTATPVFDPEGNLFRIVVNIRDTTEINKLREALSSSREKLDQYVKLVSSLSYDDDGHIFNSPAMKRIRAMGIRFAQVDAHLLVIGETGVGKEVITDLVQKNSDRKDGPFIKINCSAIPESLLESQLFGYEEGAFTGAKKQGAVGLLEMADKGTAFLDEVSEIPLSVQVKLLRFLQQKEFYRVGGKKIRKVDVRIIAATNRNLEQMVDEGTFRSDLYYRLNVLRLVVPPLRERREDIYPLSEMFLKQFNERYGMSKAFSSDVYQLLMDYEWPGNVRELQNLIERLVVAAPKDEIQPRCLPSVIRRRQTSGELSPASSRRLSYRQARDQFEHGFWQDALSSYGTVRQIAAAVGVDHSTVVKKAARYHLETETRRARRRNSAS